jgi:hypothetical protein
MHATALRARLHLVGDGVLDLLGFHRGVLGERALAPLARDLLATTSALLVGHLVVVTQLAVDRRDLDPLGLGPEQLPLQPHDLRLHLLGARLLIGLDHGQTVLLVGDQLLLRGDQRLLLRDDLAELTLALLTAAQLLLELRDQAISRVGHSCPLHHPDADGKTFRDPFVTIAATKWTMDPQASVSARYRRRLPERGTLHACDVDPVQQHR